MALEGFFTFREYMQRLDGSLTASMEDYMEMAYRLCEKTGYTRINELSAALNVQPPAASKMVQKLAEMGMLDYEKYGLIILNDNGHAVGKALLARHNTVERLLRMLGIDEVEILKETELVEHTLSDNTIAQIDLFLDFWQSYPDLAWRYRAYLEYQKMIKAQASNNKAEKTAPAQSTKPVTPKPDQGEEAPATSEEKAEPAAAEQTEESTLDDYAEQPIAESDEVEEPRADAATESDEAETPPTAEPAEEPATEADVEEKPLAPEPEEPAIEADVEEEPLASKAEELPDTEGGVVKEPPVPEPTEKPVTEGVESTEQTAEQ